MVFILLFSGEKTISQRQQPPAGLDAERRPPPADHARPGNLFRSRRESDDRLRVQRSPARLRLTRSRVAIRRDGVAPARAAAVSRKREDADEPLALARPLRAALFSHAEPERHEASQ